jgi:hypothetical protein
MRRLVLLPFLVLLAARSVSATPSFPGAKRRADPTGRWYVTVETQSDRCALVERASGSPPLEELVDVGDGRHGVPSTKDPIRQGDRVVVRSRLGGYPLDFLPASDGSGFAAIASDYDEPGFPKGEVVTLLHWVPADGPRRAFPLPEPAPVPDMPVGYTTPWRVERVAAGAGVVVVSSGAGARTAVRVGDGEVRPVAPGAEGTAERLFSTPPRSQTVVPETKGPLSPARRDVVLAAIRGDASLGLTAFDRIPIVTRAFDLLGVDAGAALLERLEGPRRRLADPERNVMRAAYWTLLHHPEGVALATSALADPKRPVEVRESCAWIVAESDPKTTAPLLAAMEDPEPRVAEAAGWALADRRWDAAPQFLELLRTGRGPPHVVATYFEEQVVEGSVPLLRAALARAPAGSELRSSLAKALEVQE